jgi:exodeoxyribonuclease-3
VVSTHLNPFSPYRRMREARFLAARYRPGKGPVLLAGDLNALAPATDHTARLAALSGPYARRHLAPDGTADTRAVAALLDGGFVDLWQTTGQGEGLTVPTTQGGGHEFSTTGMRLDYLMASPSLAARATNARVLRGDEAEYASDHYPLTVDLDL